MESYEIIAEYEGYSIEEAKLVFAERKDLPMTAFCGPDMSYPANDAKSVRMSFDKLSKFGREIPRAVALKICHRLIEHAKKYEINCDLSKVSWLFGEDKVEEVFKEMNKDEERLVDWLDEELTKFVETVNIEEVFWIQKAIGKKGALRSQLGIKKDEKIPASILQRIKNAETGTTVSFRGKRIKVTTQLKRRVILALRLGKMKKK